MLYCSTRGQVPFQGFADTVLGGLCEDGGLAVPTELPNYRERWPDWRGLAYPELAYEVLKPFTGELPNEQLKTCCQRAYGESYMGPVAPLRQVGDRYLLELIHGPTLAFKDVALQLLGRLFECLLEARDETLNVVAATSGDTGSAAIHGLSVSHRCRVFVTHPAGRIAELQRRQMTTVLNDSVFNLAVEGTFDDCQRMVKELASDLDFKRQYRIGAVNSINWARIAAQIVYYFAAYLQTPQSATGRPVVFSVPTGNFGNILAAEYARRMGLPIATLILASNSNDILPRYFQSGTYRKGVALSTASPAMDIQVASNFERYLSLLVDQDGRRVRTLMAQFQQVGQLQLPPPTDGSWRAYSCTDEQTLDAVKAVYRSTGKLLDPHTATAWWAMDQCFDSLPKEAAKVVVATAHPAKFPTVLRDCVPPTEPQLTHPRLERLKELPERLYKLDSSSDELKRFVSSHS